jgi:hypothetical protein
MKFNKEADEYIEKLYNSVGATTWEQKYNTLLLKLDLNEECLYFSHNPTVEQKVGMLEYDLVERVGLFYPTYC